MKNPKEDGRIKRILKATDKAEKWVDNLAGYDPGATAVLILGGILILPYFVG